MTSQCACCAQHELRSFLKGSLIEELDLKQKNSFAGEVWGYDTGRSIFVISTNKMHFLSLNLFQ